VLVEKQDIAAEKAAWLTRHHRDCGDLYGMLPLVKGLPVSLTDHIDRNPEKNFLRGRIGCCFLYAWRYSILYPSPALSPIPYQIKKKRKLSYLFCAGFSNYTARIEYMFLFCMPGGQHVF
jgi:hypothetical protein